jgi:AmmeMemoRadiSam system protein A
LLALARRTVIALARGEPLPDPGVGPVSGRGAFVSLHRHGELRGCIGHLVSDRPLGEVVRDMAAAASRDDPRFPPVRADELEGLDVEVSVLTTPVPARAEEVEPGRHGLIVRRGPYQGVLLPQVAVEQRWDRETFLAMTCRKAGLPPQAWRDPRTELLVFEAQIIRDESA